MTVLNKMKTKTGSAVTARMTMRIANYLDFT